MAPVAIVSCWSCDAPNPPGRIFCAECGTFIAVGSKIFSRGSTSRPSVATAMAGSTPAMGGSASAMAGTMPLGSYSVAMAARERSSRRRLLLAVVSVLLAAVIGVSAIYAAITRGGGSTPEPAAAVIVSPTAAPTEATTTQAPPTEALPTEATPTEALPPEATPTEALPTEAAPTDELDAQPIEEVAAEPELVEAGPTEDSAPAGDAPAIGSDIEARETGPGQPSEPAREAVPEAADQVVGPASDVGSTEPVDPATSSESTRDPVPDNPAVWRNGWVCEGQLSLKDERLRDWAITRVSFLPGAGFERVALQLERVGDGSGGAAALTVEAFPTARVKQEVPAVRQPSAGRNTIALQFRGGVRSEVGLRGYQPRGLSAVKELNTYPVGRTASRVLISSSTDGCFRVRVPAFSSSPRARRGQVLIDIKS